MSKREILEANGYVFRYVEYFPSRIPEVYVRVGDWIHTYQFTELIDTGQTESYIWNDLVAAAWLHYQSIEDSHE